MGGLEQVRAFSYIAIDFLIDPEQPVIVHLERKHGVNMKKKSLNVISNVTFCSSYTLGRYMRYANAKK